jgi:hypothetical protein
MGGGIVGTVTAGERVNSTGPQVAGLFFVHAKFRKTPRRNFFAEQSHSLIRSGLRRVYSWHVQVVISKVELGAITLLKR